MKKKYTKKQIQEAIKYWKNQLKFGNYKKLNENFEDAVAVDEGIQQFNAEYDDLVDSYKKFASTYKPDISEYDRKMVQVCKEAIDKGTMIISDEARKWFIDNTSIPEDEIDEFLSSNFEWYVKQ